MVVLFKQRKWSGRRDSNSRHQPWQGCYLRFQGISDDIQKYKKPHEIRYKRNLAYSLYISCYLTTDCYMIARGFSNQDSALAPEAYEARGGRLSPLRKRPACLG